jgi:molybdate transport system substrate-binding protein
LSTANHEIRLLSGGAAQALVDGVKQRFADEHGCEVRGTFGAVGTMRDKLLAGEPCDVLILSQSLIDGLVADGHALADTVTPLGTVKTGVAVRAGEPQPDVSSAQALKQSLQAASAVFCPDTAKATAGIHFLKVLNTLGIAGELGARLRMYPNGATAMREMAQSGLPGAIGCTQVTEILYTPGVQLVGLLPQEFELATVYTAAVCAKARAPQLAREFIGRLASPDVAAVRRACGFEAA